MLVSGWLNDVRERITGTNDAWNKENTHLTLHFNTLNTQRLPLCTTV